MYICDNPNCNLWLHKQCLIDASLKKTYEKLVGKETETNGTAKANGKLGRPAKKPAAAWVGKFSARIKDSEDGPPTIVIKDLRAGQASREWEEGIPCLECGEILQ